MSRSYTGHDPVRVPDGSREQTKAMVIQINNLFDDLYRRINRLMKELDELKNPQEGEDDG